MKRLIFWVYVELILQPVKWILKKDESWLIEWIFRQTYRDNLSTQPFLAAGVWNLSGRINNPESRSGASGLAGVTTNRI